jgi:DNA recombination protein RmuC
VPVESALVAALETDGELYRDALDARVIIVTPSTLLALLRTCALQWQQAKLNENARRIGENAQELLKRLQKFAGDVASVGKALDSASRAYNDAVGSFNRRLLPAARDTAELAGEIGIELDELDAQSRAVRDDIVLAKDAAPRELE